MTLTKQLYFILTYLNNLKYYEGTYLRVTNTYRILLKTLFCKFNNIKPNCRTITLPNDLTT